MAELEKVMVTKNIEKQGIEWAQARLFEELSGGANNEQVAALTVGAAVLIGALLRMSDMNEQTAIELVRSYFSRVSVTRINLTGKIGNA